MTVQSILSWPGRRLKPIGVACLAALASLVVNGFWLPTVKPIMPAELSSTNGGSLGDQSRGGEDSLDFIFRPLFLADRRPPERVVDAPTSADNEVVVPADTPALDSYTLVGIFSSGDLAGVILKDAQEQQFRLYTGESLEGWRLTGTALRAATFKDSAGLTGTLELSVASSLPAPVAVLEQRSDEIEVSPNAQGKSLSTNQADGGARETGLLTFEAVARRQRREQEQQADGSSPEN